MSFSKRTRKGRTGNLRVIKPLSLMGNIPVTPTPSIFSKVLPYKAYRGTNGRCAVAFPFLEGLEASKAQRYKWRAYCGTNWRCTASTFQRHVVWVWGFMNSALLLKPSDRISLDAFLEMPK